MAAADKTFAEMVKAGEVPLSPAQESPAQTPRFAGGGVGVLPPDTGAESDAPTFARSGFAAKDLKQLRHAAPEDTLDLHGMTAAQAHAAAERFLAGALARRARVVEIVHGRGLHSADGGGGVLRRKVRAWLKGCDAVLAYAEPVKNPGCLLIKLRARRR